MYDTFAISVSIKAHAQPQKRGSFSNQIRVSLTAPVRCVVKIFTNGSLHITGLRHESDIKPVADFVYKCIVTHPIYDLRTVDIPKGNLETHNGRIIGINKYLDQIDTYTRMCIESIGTVYVSNKRTQTGSLKIYDNTGLYIGQISPFGVQKRKHPMHTRVYDTENMTIVSDKTKQVIGSLKIMPTGFYHPDKKNLSEWTYSVNCINIITTLNRAVDNTKLYNKLLLSNSIVLYTPDTYAGLKYIHKVGQHDMCKGHCMCRNITFLVFQSGKIISTGFTSTAEIQPILVNTLRLFEE